MPEAINLMANPGKLGVLRSDSKLFVTSDSPAVVFLPADHDSNTVSRCRRCQVPLRSDLMKTGTYFCGAQFLTIVVTLKFGIVIISNDA